MAEEAQVETTEEGQETKETKEQRVPYERFEEVNQKAKKYAAEMEEMRTQLAELQDRDKTEVERERAQRERMEQMNQELTNRITSLEKGSWVRSAALDLGFHDPEDAVAHLGTQLGGLEDQREAKRLVEKLAKQKEHLVRKEEKKERPSIGRVFQGTESPQQGQQPQRTTREQQAQEQEIQFADGLRKELAKFLPENSDNWYEGKGA